MSEEKNVVVPEKFSSLVEQIEKMSVLDLSELVKVLEDKFGVSATAPVAVAAVGVAAVAEEEKTSFDVELTSAGDTKIAVIKVVKEITGVGLADAKALVDGAPKVIKAGLKKDEAEALRKKLTDAGAVVSLK